MYDELPKASLAREFCDMARGSKVNGHCAIAAQKFFKQALMGVDDPSVLGAFPIIPKEKLPGLQLAYLDALSRVIQTLTGTEFQSGVTYDQLMAAIPEHEGQVRFNVDKIALHVGLREPRR